MLGAPRHSWFGLAAISLAHERAYQSQECHVLGIVRAAVEEIADISFSDMPARRRIRPVLDECTFGQRVMGKKPVVPIGATEDQPRLYRHSRTPVLEGGTA